MKFSFIYLLPKNVAIPKCNFLQTNQIYQYQIFQRILFVKMKNQIFPLKTSFYPKKSVGRSVHCTVRTYSQSLRPNITECPHFYLKSRNFYSDLFVHFCWCKFVKECYRQKNSNRFQCLQSRCINMTFVI